MLERIQHIFNRVTNITDFVITPNTRLNKKEIDISSFTLIQLFCELEDEFDIEISNADIKQNFRGVCEFIDLWVRDALKEEDSYM